MNVSFYDNSIILDNLLSKPEGLFCLINEATRVCQDDSLIIGKYWIVWVVEYIHIIIIKFIYEMWILEVPWIHLILEKNDLEN